MKLGELVEILIRVHDCADLSRREDDAVCAACNILDRMPSQWDEEQAREWLRETVKSAPNMTH